MRNMLARVGLLLLLPATAITGASFAGPQDQPMASPPNTLSEPGSATAATAAGTVEIVLDLVPDDLQSGSSSALVVRIDPAGFEPVDTRLRLTGPTGLTLTPAEIELPAFQAEITRIVELRAEPDLVAGADHVVVAEVVAAEDDGEAVLGSQYIATSYVRSVALGTYLLLGLTGVVVGYAIRLGIGVLKSLPRPSPAPPTGVGPITRFVKKHYYLVDAGVTAVLGAIVLISLVTDGLPPEAARTSYGSFVAGAGLGLLANSELITRIQ